MDQIVDIEGLAQVLHCSGRTLEKQWQQYPHFFIGEGRDLRGARFDIGDVITYLKKRDYKDAIPRQKKEDLDRSKTHKWSEDKKNRIYNKIRSTGMGNRNSTGFNPRPRERGDCHHCNLLISQQNKTRNSEAHFFLDILGFAMIITIK